MAWERLGEPGTAGAAVLCHGTPWSSALWRPVAAELARTRPVYLWDMPGYGRSSKDPAHAVDLGVQGELFADLLGEWGLERPHVVAHDFGGAVSLRAMLLHGAAYASLALVDVVALRPWGSPFFRLVHDHADVFVQLPPAIHRGVVEAYVRGASHRGLDAGQLATLVDPWVGDEGQPAFYAQIAQADERFTEELEPCSAASTSPCTSCGARRTPGSRWTVPPGSRTAIPGATVRLVDGAGHLIQYDATAELTDVLQEWLELEALRSVRLAPWRRRMDRRWASTSTRCRLPLPRARSAASFLRSDPVCACRTLPSVPSPRRAKNRLVSRLPSVTTVIWVMSFSSAHEQGGVHQRVPVAVAAVRRQHEQERAVHRLVEGQRPQRATAELHRRDDAVVVLGDDQALVGVSAMVARAWAASNGPRPGPAGSARPETAAQRSISSEASSGPASRMRGA